MNECGFFVTAPAPRPRNQQYAGFILTAPTLDLGMPMCGDQTGSNDLFFPILSEAVGAQSARGKYSIGKLAVNLYVAPGNENTVRFTLRKNGADTPVAVQISNFNLRAENLNSVRVVKDDLIYWRIERIPADQPFDLQGVLTWEEAPA